MKKIIVEPSFWELFPEANIHCLILPTINNQQNEEANEQLKKMLDSATNEAKKYIDSENFSQSDVVKEWRNTFSKFKTKKGARSSIEALLKRANQGHEFSNINPLVDLYNSISLKYAVPCGGEDLDKIEGNLHLGKAKGGENFLPLGTDTDAPALPEEIIYYDEAGAVCRCFNWREAKRTMLTEETTNAVLVIEAINSNQNTRANEAIKELQIITEQYFGVTGEIITLNLDNPVYNITEI